MAASRRLKIDSGAGGAGLDVSRSRVLVVDDNALNHELGGEEANCCYAGGVLHDLGKIGIPDAVHSVSDTLRVIRHHHERFDGTGYPDRLAGFEIPRAARVAAVADGWDAMTSDRAYRGRLSQEEALLRLKAGAGTQWDADVVAAFVHLVDTGGPAAITGSQR